MTSLNIVALKMLPKHMKPCDRVTHAKQNCGKSLQRQHFLMKIMKHCMLMYAGCIFDLCMYRNVNHLNVTKPEERIKNNLLRIY